MRHLPQPYCWHWTCAVAVFLVGGSAGVSADEDAIQNALKDRLGAESEVVLDSVVFDDGAPEPVVDVPASSGGVVHHEVVDDFTWDYSDPVVYTPDPSPPPSVQHHAVGAPARPPPPPVEHVPVGGGATSYAVDPPAVAMSSAVEPSPPPPPEPVRAAPQAVRYIPVPPPTVRHVVMDRPRPPPPPPPPPASDCIVAKRENCTKEELEFLDMSLKNHGSDHETLLSEAKRLRSKIDSVKKSQRKWLGQRAHILDGLLAQLPPAPPKKRRSEEL